MSAILGLLHRDGQPVDPQQLQPALPFIAHYGDGQRGLWCQQQIGLASQQDHLRAINAARPTPLTWQHWTIVADVRLDNRAELIHALRLSAPEDTLSDAALILRAYAQWGLACVARLLGDFAFAIWDHAEQHLICARDFIGARPLYYYHHNGIVAFSTDLDALIALPAVQTEIDDAEVYRALLGRGPEQYYHPHRTYFRHIYRVPFGHYLYLTQQNMTLTRYWSPDQVQPVRYYDDQAYIAHTRDIVEKAIQCRIPEKALTGAHLSGGLDSSSIAILAARHLHSQGRDLPVYSWSPPAGTTPDATTEQHRIEAICAQEGLRCQYVPFVPTQAETQRFLSRQQARGEHGVMQRAAKQGVRVMLTGWGGDEFITFTGRGIRSDQFLRGQWKQLWQSMAWDSSWPTMRGNLFRFWRDVVLVLLPDTIYRYWHPGQNMPLFPMQDDCLDPAFAATLQDIEQQMPINRYELRGRRRNQAKLYLAGHVTDRIENWAYDGARHGVQYQYPLLDRRVVEWALALPDALFLRDGIGRYAFFEAMRHDLPPQTHARISDKSEPSKQTHQQVIADFMLARWEDRYDAPLLADDIPHINQACLRDLLATHHGNQSRKAFRAWQLARLWHTLSNRLEDIANRTKTN